MDLAFEKRGGLLPVVVQDLAGQILMVASMNQEAWYQTVSSRRATFWSTSRNELWTKGSTSGDFLEVQDILVDCDLDTVLLKVRQLGNGACHTLNASGQTRRSCFYRRVSLDGKQLENLDP
jgi:phosphoribosyl-AMP cyclohydrolase